MPRLSTDEIIDAATLLRPQIAAAIPPDADAEAVLLVLCELASSTGRSLGHGLDNVRDMLTVYWEDPREWRFPLPPDQPSLAGGLCRVDGWELITIVPCPACDSGRLVWAEAGNVPGWRVCNYCGHEWLAAPRGNEVVVAIPEVDRGSGPELAWEPPRPDAGHIDKAAWVSHGSGADLERAKRYRPAAEVGGAGEEVDHDDE